MSCKKFLVPSAAAVLLLASVSVAPANDASADRDSGLSAHQTELDEQYARSHPTTMPGTPARPTSAYGYGYVPSHRPAAKHRQGVHR